MPTLHETGLRRNPSTVSNCTQTTRLAKNSEVRWAYVFLGALYYECVAAEDCGNKHLEFHAREVLAHTRPIFCGDHMVSFLARGAKFGCFADLGPYENGLNVFWISA